MKIDKEKLNSLKQMDRIEYRQKLNEIKESFDGLNFPSFINSSLYLLGFVLVLAFSSYNISKELFVSIFNIFAPLARLIMIIGIFILLIDIGAAFLKKKEMRKLNEEYFSVEIKK